MRKKQKRGNRTLPIDTAVFLVLVLALIFALSYVGGGVTGAVTFTLPVEPVIEETLPEEQPIVGPPVPPEEELIEGPIEEAPEELTEETLPAPNKKVVEEESLPEEKPTGEASPEGIIEKLSADLGISGIVGIMAAPVVGNVTLNSSSGTNFTSENLTLYWDITDSDGDDVKNITNWKLNGTSITVLNMPFENASGNQSGDYSGFENNGTTNTATWNATGGYDGKGAYEFDGVDDYIRSYPLTITPTTQNFTLSAWAYIKDNVSDSAHGGIISLRDANHNRMTVRDSDKAVYSEFNNGSTIGCLSEAGLSTNAWHHLVTIVNKTAINIYIDGTFNKTCEFLSGLAHVPVEFIMGRGASKASDTYWFNGTIDDVMIFNRSLSADQIYAIYINRTYLLSSDETFKGDNWSACITPNDGTEDGVENCSVDLIIENTAPNTTQVILNATSSSNYSTDNLTCYANIIDEDEEIVYANYTWYNTSEVHLSGQSSSFMEGTLTLISTLDSANTTAGENWTCEIQAYDGTIYESDWTNSSNLTIALRCGNDICEPEYGESTTNCSADCKEGLMGYWSFNSDHRNSTHVYDLSGSSYHATRVREEGFVNSLRGQAIILNGTDQYLSLPTEVDNLSLFGGENGTLTVSALVKSDNVSKYNQICVGCGPIHYLSLGSTETAENIPGVVSHAYDYTTNANYWPKYYPVLRNDVWAHIIFVLEGSVGYKYYINCNLNKQVTYAGIGLKDHGNSYIGYSAASVSNYFNGSIDEIKIWNRTLNATEIADECSGISLGVSPITNDSNIEENTTWFQECKLYSDNDPAVSCANVFQPDNTTTVSGNHSLRITGVRENELNYRIVFPVERNQRYKVNLSLKIVNRTTYNYLNLSYPSTMTIQQDGIRDTIDSTKGIWGGKYFFYVNDKNILPPISLDTDYRVASDIDWFSGETYVSSGLDPKIVLRINLQGYEGTLNVDDINIEKVDSHVDNDSLQATINYTFQGMQLIENSSDPLYVITNTANFSFENDNLIIWKNNSIVANLTFPESFLDNLNLNSSYSGLVLIENDNITFSIAADSSALVKLKQNTTVEIESTIAGEDGGYHAFEAGIIFATDYSKGILFSPIYTKQTILDMPYTLDSGSRDYTYSDTDFEDESLKIWDTLNNFSETNWKISYNFTAGDGFLAEVFPPKEFNETKYCKDRMEMARLDINTYPNGSYDYFIQKFAEHFNIAFVLLSEFAVVENNMDPPDYYYKNDSGHYVHSSDSNATAYNVTTKSDVAGPFNVTEKEAFGRFVNKTHQQGMKVIIYQSPAFYYTSDVDTFLDGMESFINEFNLDGVYFDGTYSRDPLRSLELMRKARSRLGDKFITLHDSWTWGLIYQTDHFRTPVFDAYADLMWVGEGVKKDDNDTWKLNYCGRNVSNTASVLLAELRPVNWSLSSAGSQALTLSPEEQIDKTLAGHGVFRTRNSGETSYIADSHFQTTATFDVDYFFDQYNSFCLSYTCGDGTCDPGETLDTCYDDCAPDTSDIVTKKGNQYQSNSSDSIAQWVVDGEPFYKLRFTFDDDLAKDDSGNKFNPDEDLGVSYDDLPAKKTVNGNSCFEFNSTSVLFGQADTTLNLTGKNFSSFARFKRIDQNTSLQMLLSWGSGGHFYYGLSSNKLFVSIKNTSNQQNYLRGTSTIDNESWHTAGIVYENPTLKLYVDGTQEDELNISLDSFNGYPLYYIGRFSATDTTYQYRGYIDDLFATTNVLTEQQIIEYNNSLHKNFTTSINNNITCLTTNGSDYYSVSTVCGNNRCQAVETVTNCPTDCDIDRDGLRDTDDNLVGNESHLNNNLDNLTLEVNSSTNITQNFTQRLNVKFKENSTTRLEFYFNFSREQLNLSNINITKQASTSLIGSLEIVGLNLTSQGENKTAYIDIIANYNNLCIKDSDTAAVSNISSSCTAADEVSVSCPGTAGQYTCAINGSYYRLEGLSHSAVKEYPSPTTSSGSGSGTTTTITCTPRVIKCIDSLHYQECLDFGSRNKWSEDREVPKGKMCLAGEFVELTEEIMEEEIPPSLPRPPAEEVKLPGEITETTEEETSLVWMVSLIVALVLVSGIVIYLLKGKSWHLRNI